RFLDGFSLEDNWEFEDWQQRTQARLHDAVQCAVRCLVEYDEAQGETAQALSDARRWLALEPAAEEAHRRVMQLLARQGNRTAALEQYETCHRTLAAELDVPPSPETVALYEAIKTGGGSACVDWGEAPEVRSFFGRS